MNRRWPDRFKQYDALLIPVLRILLGALFIYASLDKIWSPGLFAKALSNYRLLPLFLLHPAAIVLPWLELITGLALITNIFPRAANLLAGGMLAVFTLAVLSALLRGLDFNCGCFDLDSTATNIGFLKILQNLGLMVLSILLEIHFRFKVIPSDTRQASL